MLIPFERKAYRQKLTLFAEQDVDVGGNGEFSFGDVTQEGGLTVSKRKYESHYGGVQWATPTRLQ